MYVSVPLHKVWMMSVGATLALTVHTPAPTLALTHSGECATHVRECGVWVHHTLKCTLVPACCLLLPYIDNKLFFAYLSSSLHSLFHITDWLPTLMSVATLGSFPSSHAFGGDGLDQWKSLSGNRRSRRREMLYNINPVWSFRREVNAAIRSSSKILCLQSTFGKEGCGLSLRSIYPFCHNFSLAS